MYTLFMRTCDWESGKHEPGGVVLISDSPTKNVTSTFYVLKSKEYCSTGCLTEKEPTKKLYITHLIEMDQT